MRRYILIPLILICFTATAGIYKWVDSEGKIHYSDQEVTGAEQVELPKAVTFTPPPKPAATTSNSETTSKEEQQQPHVYTKMTIVKPQMNETIHDNNGNVGVMIELTPALMKGDSITLYLDGKEVQKGLVQTSATLSHLERGSHTLRASVFDKNGIALISSSSTIFHLRIEAGESEDHTPKDNSDAYTPNFKRDESKKADYDKDYTHDYSGDFSKDYDSSDTYKEGAEKFKTGVPSKSDNFKAGSSTYTPNYQQKK